MRRAKIIFSFIVIMIVFLTGCSMEKLDGEKAKDLDYTVVKSNDIPEELQKAIEERKENGFQLTYCNDDYLYITRGYGKQNTGGYSIQVNQVYLAPESIHVEMDLIGPGTETPKEGVSYPYIVIKLERMTEQVVFE